MVTPGFVDRPRRGDCSVGQMDGEAGWWTTSGKIGHPPPLARVMGVGRQQQVGIFSVSDHNQGDDNFAGFCLACKAANLKNTPAMDLENVKDSHGSAHM